MIGKVWKLLFMFRFNQAFGTTVYGISHINGSWFIGMTISNLSKEMSAEQRLKETHESVKSFIGD